MGGHDHVIADSSGGFPTDAAREEPAAPPSNGARRGLLLGLGLGVLVALLAIFVVALLNRDSTPRLTEQAYAAAMQRWSQHGPADYNLDLELTGNRPGKVRVEVRGGEVVRMTRDGVEPSQRRTWDVWSVPGQFDTIGQELEMARDPAAAFRSPQATQMIQWAEFDSQLGYPLKYERVVPGTKFEVRWHVTRFEAISRAK